MRELFYQKRKLKPFNWMIDHSDYSKDDCLIWPFVTSNGYAILSVGDSAKLVHRFMCQFQNGKAPEDKPLALHSCGNGKEGCVNPKHLYWGDYQDNTNDRKKHQKERLTN